MNSIEPMLKMNPLDVKKMAESTEPPCEEEPGVFYRDIVRAYGRIVQKILKLIAKTLYRIWSFIVWTGLGLLAFSVFLTPFIPGFIAMFAVATLLAVLWDDVTKPIILAFIQAYNGVARAWNNFTNSVRHIGINEKFFGTRISIRLFGINLPQADIISTEIPDFWTFVYEVLTPDVFKRYILSKIFREKGYVPPPKKETCLTKI